MPAISEITRIRIPTTVMEETFQFLREAGCHRVEAIALWAGRFSSAEVFDVEVVVEPRQSAVRTEEGLLAYVDGDELFRVNRLLHEYGLRLVAQIHSHPTEAYHSETDDRFACVTAKGALSIVVPDFAMDDLSLIDLAVFRLGSGGAWTQLVEREVADLLELVSTK